LEITGPEHKPNYPTSIKMKGEEKRQKKLKRKNEENRKRAGNR